MKTLHRANPLRLTRAHHSILNQPPLTITSKRTLRNFARDNIMPSHGSDYASLTPEQLIARVRDLEARLQSQTSQLAHLQKQAAKTTPAPEKPKPAYTRSAQRSNRVFDGSKYATRYVALKIAYLGQRYNGFEHHANNSTRLPTVEEEVWRALVKTKLVFKGADEGVSWEGCEYSKAGRTDKGVSAFGNVIALRVRSARRPAGGVTKGVDGEVGGETEEAQVQEEEKFDHIHDELPYPRILNRVLPPDIRVLAWCPALPDNFSARFSCRLRKYRYFFTQPAYCPAPGTQGMADRKHRGAEREGWLDVEAMQDAAARFEGLHDFRNFCKQDPARQITNFERRVDRARIVEVEQGELGLPFLGDESVRPQATGQGPKLFAFEVWGSAFLWHQVRHMVAALFLVGQGLEQPSIIDEMLDTGNVPEKPLYEMADDHPLVLWDCVFPDLEKGGMENSLEWILPDHPVGPNAFSGGGNGRYGIQGINEVLWTSWRRAKINEVLVGQLLNVVASQRVGPDSVPLPEDDSAYTRGPSTRMFDGGAQVKHKGAYVPVMQRARQEAPEILNARWIERFPEKKRGGNVAATEEDIDE